MPFQSEKQRRYLHANHPEIAKRWERDYASGGPIAALNAQLNQLPEYYLPKKKGGIANHFKKRTKLALSIDSMTDVEFKTMYPNWDPEQFTREEYLREISETDTNGILDLSTDDTDEVAQMSTTEDEVIPSLVPSLDQEVALVAKGGISQLAKKFKDGGTPRRRYFTGAYGGGSPADTHHGGNDFSGMDSGGWDPGVSHSGSPADTGSSGGLGEDQEEDVARMMSDMGIKQDHTPDWSGSDKGWVVPEDDRPGEKIGIHDNRTARDRAYDFDFMYGHKVKPRDQWTETNKRNSWIETKQLAKDAFKHFKFGIGPVSILKFGWEQNKKKQAEIAHLQQMIDDMKAAGDTPFSPHGDTPLQLAEQLLIDLTTSKGPTGDDSGDGLTIETIASAKEDVEESPDIMSLWDRIKAGQAKRAMLVEKDIIQEQPIQLLNSGGLATLFRVKT
jgi:hypothetical protein